MSYHIICDKTQEVVGSRPVAARNSLFIFLKVETMYLMGIEGVSLLDDTAGQTKETPNANLIVGMQEETNVIRPCSP